jgi:hypothetical protein
VQTLAVDLGWRNSLGTLKSDTQNLVRLDESTLELWLLSFSSGLGSNPALQLRLVHKRVGVEAHS